MTETTNSLRAFLIFMLGVLIGQGFSTWAVNQDHPGIFLHKGGCND